MFVIRASSFLRHSSLELGHFKYDELASSLANPDRTAGQCGSDYAVHPSTENLKQFHLNRGGACEFYL
jgi:hypothetical protein